MRMRERNKSFMNEELLFSYFPKEILTSKLQKLVWFVVNCICSVVELQRFIEILSYRDTYSDDTRIVS